MEYKSLKKKIALLVGLISAWQFQLTGQNGETVFKQTCSACHSIGKGKVVGPDLKDVHKRRKEEWIVKFVKGSQALIKSGDADAKAVFEENNQMVMPDQNLSEADVKSVLAYITEQSGGTAEPVPIASSEAAPGIQDTLSASPGLVADGKSYFEGSKSFVNGGASCISCHNINHKDLIAGGVLAKDITHSYSRLGGDAGLTGILSSPPFPAMTAAFKNSPLTDPEIKAIVAFLKNADSVKTEPPQGTNPLLSGGFIGFLILFVIILAVWNKRKHATVKKDIYDRQIKAIN